MTRINLYFRNPPLGYKWIPGDRHILNFLRGVFKGKKTSGVEKVFINLYKGFDELNINYTINRPFKEIQPGEPVIVLGAGKYALEGYRQLNPVIAGIGLMTHPAQWPDLFKDYPVAKYLQHSQWTSNVYIPYFGRDRVDLWPSGIDTEKWQPTKNVFKKYDLLIYDKIMWNKEQTRNNLTALIIKKIDSLQLSYTQITYGDYKEEEYLALLQQSKAMIFLCEHESQGFACCEAMSTGVPVFAWDQGFWLDPNRFKWNDPVVPATSIPFFDNRCGMAFKDFTDFENNISSFWQNVKAGVYNPREYILENLTLKKSAIRMLEIIKSVYK